MPPLMNGTALPATWRPAWDVGAPTTGRPRRSAGSRSSSSPSCSGCGRYEVDRSEHGRARRVGPHGQDPRRGLQAACRTRASSSRAARFRRPTPAFAAAVDDVIARLSKLDVVQNVQLAARLDGNAAQISETAARRSSSSRSAARRTRPPTRSTRSSTRSTRRRTHTHSSSSASSATPARSTRSRPPYGEDLGKAGLLSLPVTLIILVVAFGALVAAGIPLLLALTAVFATFGLVARRASVVPMANQAGAVVLLIGLAVGVDYSLFYLAARARGAGRRAQRAGAVEIAAATSGRVGARLRPHRDGCDGRDVPDRRLDLQLARRGDDHGGRSRGARLAHRAPGSLAARGHGRPGPRSRASAACAATTARAGSGARSSTASSGARSLSVVLAGGLLVALAIPALQLRMVQPGTDTFPQDLAGDPGLQPDAGVVPRRGVAGQRGRQGLRT